mgnify:CR=1 FL=1
MGALSERVEEVWPSSGIRDLPEDWREFAIPAMRDIENLWRERKERLLGSEELKTFTERLHREWALETGQIENLYDIERGVTQTLIEQGFDAALMPHGSVDKDPEYIQALLNDQQAALEGLFSFVRQERPLSTSYIKELQAAMCRSQTKVAVMDNSGHRFETELLKGEYKKLPNYPKRNGTTYHYCPPEHAAAEMDRLVAMHLAHQGQDVAPEVEAAWLHHRFTQIHPFQDGNGRVARALASLVLIRAGLFPMVVSRDDKAIYIESLERADHGDLRSLIFLIAREQQSRFSRAMTISAAVAPPEDNVKEAASRYGEAIEHTRKAREARQGQFVKDLNRIIMPGLEIAAQAATRELMRIDPQARVSIVTRANFDAPNDLQQQLGVRVGRPSMFADILIKSSQVSRYAVLVVAAVLDEMDPGVATFVFARYEDDVEVIMPVRVWQEADEVNRHPDRGLKWAEAALTETLNYFRKKFA